MKRMAGIVALAVAVVAAGAVVYGSRAAPAWGEARNQQPPAEAAPGSAQTQASSVCGTNPSPPDPNDPAIRVYSPVPGLLVASPIMVSGRARVFEAVVSLALKDAAGATIAQGTTMAQGGAPALAPFSTALTFSVTSETPACLWVFEASARDGSPINVVQIPLTLEPASARFVESALYLGALRPCIPAQGQATCDATRAALWNGDADAWAARGVTDPDARFNETVVFRVQAGDPGAIRNIARILGWPYVKITRVHFGPGGDLAEVTNLGGGAQDMTGWTLRSPARNLIFHFPDGFVLGPGDSQVVCGLCLPSCPAPAPGQPIPPCRPPTAFEQGFGVAGVWPDGAGEAVLFYDALNLPGDDTRYSADPANQPPQPNLQGTIAVTTPAPAPSPHTVTLADDGTTVRLHVGDRFLLQLGEDYDWNVSIADQSIVSRVIGVLVIRGAQGLFQARTPGSTTLTATGDPACRSATPPCGLPSRSFHITIAVE